MAQNERIKVTEKDTLPDKINPKDEVVLISVRMEGDLLDALKTAAAAEGKPYQTLMKQLLREKLKVGGQNELAREMEKLKGEVKELKAGYRRLTTDLKKSSGGPRHSRSTRRSG